MRKMFFIMITLPSNSNEEGTTGVTVDRKLTLHQHTKKMYCKHGKN